MKNARNRSRSVVNVQLRLAGVSDSVRSSASRDARDDESGLVPVGSEVPHAVAAIKVIAAEQLPIELACRDLGVSVSGYYEWLNRGPSVRALRHTWRTELIIRAHTDSRGIYGVRRVHAELTLGLGISVGRQAVELLMRRAGLQGLSGRPRYRRVPNVATAGDHVGRQFARSGRDQLWVTPTSPSTRLVRVRCAVPSFSTHSVDGSWGGPSTVIRRPHS